MKTKFAIFLVAIFSFSIVSKAQNAYVKEIENWRTEHENELKGQNGWLTVAGLYWLKEGVNTIGAGSGFDIELTENFKQGKFGEIEFKNGAATLRVENNVEALNEGKKVSEIELVSDEKGKPTEIQVGSQTFYLIKREDRYGIRLKDENSVQRTNFTGLHWFPVNKNYKVTAKFEPFAEPKEVLIPNVLGGNFKMKSPGILRFKFKGKEYSLQPVEEDEKLFIIFRDLSGRAETYGAGRFLYAASPVNGKVVLDFNKAENPPCAFTPFATCPLPPAQNRLEVEIKAGEKRYNH